MYYVLSITSEEGPGPLHGPGTWEQCVEKGYDLISQLKGRVEETLDQDDKDVFDSDGVWDQFPDLADGVYIIQAESL